ncbi:Zinc knuckle [Popillia japonica]|uniref:Zinc knuckle n=1 Tax=Popillia japonica TaxID=7064 RepID=A0AAW1KLK2_POPJA
MQDEYDDSEEDDNDEQEDVERKDDEEQKKIKENKDEKTPRFPISFRDVEDSMRTFDGSEDFSMEKWSRKHLDFLLVSEMWKIRCEFSTKINSVKLHETLRTGLNSWRSLKRALLKEFSTKINSVKLHETLRTRQIKKGESAQEYLLVMKEIASRGSIDDESLIQYAKSSSKSDGNVRCFLCGAMGHRSADCAHKSNGNAKSSSKSDGNHTTANQKPQIKIRRLRAFPDCAHKSKGFKCFKCNNFGHKAHDCKSKTANQDSSIKSLSVTTNNMYHKQIGIGNITVNALIDTGSAVNVIRQDIHRAMGSPRLQKSLAPLIGFGGHSVNMLGFYEDDIVVDDDTFFTKIFVAPNGTMNIDAVIGQELLRHAEMKSSAVNVIRQDIHRAMGSPRLQKSLAQLIGFGGHSVNMLGFYEDDIVIDDDTFFTKIFVAPNGTMNIDAELLRHAEMKSSIDNITICKLMKEPAIMTIEMKSSIDNITICKLMKEPAIMTIEMTNLHEPIIGGLY